MTTTDDTLPIKRRIKIKPGLSRKHWEEFWKGGKARGKLQTEGIVETPTGKPLYHYDLGLDSKEVRYCARCYRDLAPGETLVSPVVFSWGDGYKAAPDKGMHTRCVTVEEWRDWLAEPRSYAAARSMWPKTPPVTVKALQALYAAGIFTPAKGWKSYETAVETLKGERTRMRRALGRSG